MATQPTPTPTARTSRGRPPNRSAIDPSLVSTPDVVSQGNSDSSGLTQRTGSNRLLELSNDIGTLRQDLVDARKEISTCRKNVNQLFTNTENLKKTNEELQAQLTDARQLIGDLQSLMESKGLFLTGPSPVSDEQLASIRSIVRGAVKMASELTNLDGSPSAKRLRWNFEENLLSDYNQSQTANVTHLLTNRWSYIPISSNVVRDRIPPYHDHVNIYNSCIAEAFKTRSKADTVSAAQQRSKGPVLTGADAAILTKHTLNQNKAAVLSKMRIFVKRFALQRSMSSFSDREYDLLDDYHAHPKLQFVELVGEARWYAWPDVRNIYSPMFLNIWNEINQSPVPVGSTAEGPKFIHEIPPASHQIKAAEQFWPDWRNLQYTPQAWMFLPSYLEKNPNLPVAPFNEPTSVADVLEHEWYLKHARRRMALVTATPQPETQSDPDAGSSGNRNRQFASPAAPRGVDDSEELYLGGNGTYRSSDLQIQDSPLPPRTTELETLADLMGDY